MFRAAPALLTPRHPNAFVLVAAAVTLVCAVLDAPTAGIAGWVFLALATVFVIAVMRRPAPEPAPLHGALTEPPRLLALLREGLWLGLTGFGGGFAVLTQIEHRFVRRSRWVRDEEFIEAAALAQSLPGAIAFNALAFLGLRLGRIRGAIAMVGGFVLPSFVLLVALARLYVRLGHLPAIDGAFHLLTPAVAGVVGAVGVRLGGRVALTREGDPAGWRGLIEDRIALAVVIGSAVLVSVVGLGVLEVILIAGGVGVARALAPGGIRFLEAIEVRWRWMRARTLLAIEDEFLRGRRPWWRRRTEDDEVMAIAPPLAFGPALALAWGPIAHTAGTLAGTFRGALDDLRVIGGLTGIFLRAGALTFGGGFVMIPMLEAELVEARGWLSPNAFADAMAIGQVTPGPVVMTATFAGQLVAGFPGALLATLAVFLPSFVLVLLVASSIERFRNALLLQAFLQGLQPAVVGLLMAAAATLARSGIHDWTGAGVGAASLLLLVGGRVSPVWVVAGAALLGLALGVAGIHPVGFGPAG